MEETGKRAGKKDLFSRKQPSEQGFAVRGRSLLSNKSSGYERDKGIGCKTVFGIF